VVSRLLNFTREGETISLTAYLNEENKPAYEVEFLHEYEGKVFSSEELLAFAQALGRDVESWGGLLHRFPEETFDDASIAEFEETWGGGRSDQAQGCNAGRRDAE